MTEEKRKEVVEEMMSIRNVKVVLSFVFMECACRWFRAQPKLKSEHGHGN
jgi:hypothetical protein